MLKDGKNSKVVNMWFSDVLKAEEYDPCCEGGRTSIVGIVQFILKKWPPHEGLPTDDADSHQIADDIEQYILDFIEFLKTLPCRRLRAIVRESAKGDLPVPRIIPEGDIANYWVNVMEDLAATWDNCDNSETYADKLEFNDGLMPGTPADYV